jgi:hypothetical protein
MRPACRARFVHYTSQAAACGLQQLLILALRAIGRCGIEARGKFRDVRRHLVLVLLTRVPAADSHR